MLSTALAYAVEQGLLERNLVPSMKVKRQKLPVGIDRRVVVNPAQARSLLDAVAVTLPSGPRLVGFFAVMYYAALRPEEAVNLRAANLTLPPTGWGWILVDGAATEVERHWTDTDRRREERELKHRAVGETRRVPCPPPLVGILRDHLGTYGVDEQGRLFRGTRGALISGVTYRRTWDRARKAALSSEQYESPLARRPYDLRHAAVSTWLNGGVPATQVAEWAGHGVEVLLRVYAKCLDGSQDDILRRIDLALGS